MKVNQAKPLINSLAGKGNPFFVLIDFELQQIVVKPLDQLNDEVLYDFQGVTNHMTQPSTSKSEPLKVTPYPFYDYYHQFQKVHEELHLGNSYLTNLTAKHKIETPYTLREIFDQVSAKYKLHVNLDGIHFTCFSPEIFVTIRDGIISSYPMKGTIEADFPQAKEQLLADKKETAEHNTIVDLIRNDLSLHAKKVTVTKSRYMDRITSNGKDLFQMSSEIQGELSADYRNNLGDILFSMLPAGSISGAPKKKTVQIIQQAEEFPRGYYTGIAGLYDGDNFDSCVLIRYIEEAAGQKFYRSGGGITFQSIVEKEYQEMVDKIYLPFSEVLQKKT